jgi:hypothetical protein
MLNNLKIVFIHGIDNQSTNYSSSLYKKILNKCSQILAAKGFDKNMIKNTLSKTVQHEILWANITTDLTNRYMQLQYAEKSHFFWGFTKKPIDPLVIQIMQYIKDKGDKKNGHMSVLRKIHNDFKNIIETQDIGIDDTSKTNLIIVAHSLGSVIAFDYVMGFRKDYCLNNLDKEISLDCFITMGSPIPLFTTAMGHPDSDMLLPYYIKKWTNILSPRDAVARYIQPFFRNIKIHENEVSTGFFPLKAHTGYWKDDLTAEIIALEVLSALKLPNNIN